MKKEKKILSLEQLVGGWGGGEEEGTLMLVMDFSLQ